MTVDQKDKFIQLRAQGLSFDKIAEQTGISKPTLIKMNRELQVEVNRLKLINLESLADSYGMLRAQRIQHIGNLLNRVDTALEQVEFDQLPTDRIRLLFELRFKLTDRLQREFEFTHKEPGIGSSNVEGMFACDMKVD